MMSTRRVSMLALPFHRIRQWSPAFKGIGSTRWGATRSIRPEFGSEYAIHIVDAVATSVMPSALRRECRRWLRGGRRRRGGGRGAVRVAEGEALSASGRVQRCRRIVCCIHTIGRGAVHRPVEWCLGRDNYIPVSMRMRQRPPFGDVAAGRTASCLFDRGTLWGTAVVVVAAVACLNGFRRRHRRHHRCGRRPPASASSSRD